MFLTKRNINNSDALTDQYSLSDKKNKWKWMRRCKKKF